MIITCWATRHLLKFFGNGSKQEISGSSQSLMEDLSNLPPLAQPINQLETYEKFLRSTDFSILFIKPDGPKR